MSKIYSLWLHKLGIREYIKIKMLKDFKSYQGIFEASEKQYEKCGLNAKQIEKLQMSKKDLTDIVDLERKCEEKGIKMLDILDSEYPQLLRQIPDPPIMLFALGQTSEINKPSIAIVGSRKCSEYGFNMTRRIAKELAEYGLTVISGMAMGIDEAAHKGALEGGITIAVLGTGIDVCYPSSNYSIYKKIPVKGCILSEYPIGTPPLPFQFPKRNRIISGMSLGVLVTEANVKSGSLITADLSLQYNRDVYAIPGNIESKLSTGTNKLIQQGAKLVLETQDIIEELPVHIKEKIYNNKEIYNNKMNIELAQQESIVYDYVSWQPTCFTEIIKNLDLPYEIINTILVKLELKGLIKRLPGERYVRV